MWYSKKTNKMVNNNTDFFAYVDNIAKIKGVESVLIFGEEDSSAEYTIAIPTYKRTEFLKEAIDSALNQDCSFSYNVIVVDNNPERDDDTEKMMESYKNTKNLSYYKNAENLGMGGNWNRCISMPKTEWVVLLHDDDILHPSFLRETLNVAYTYNADIVNSGFFYWDERKESKPEVRFVDSKYPVVKSTLESNFCWHRAGMPTGVMYKRDILIEEGGFNQDFYPALDYILHARLSYKYKFLIFEKPLTIYRYSVNESLSINTKIKYIPLEYDFNRYVGELLNYPKAVIDFFVTLIARLRVYGIGKKEYKIGDQRFKALGWCGRIFYAVLFRLTACYFRKKNTISYL